MPGLATCHICLARSPCTTCILLLAHVPTNQPQGGPPAGLPTCRRPMLPPAPSRDRSPHAGSLQRNGSVARLACMCRPPSSPWSCWQRDATHAHDTPRPAAPVVPVHTWLLCKLGQIQLGYERTLVSLVLAPKREVQSYPIQSTAGTNCVLVWLHFLSWCSQVNGPCPLHRAGTAPPPYSGRVVQAAGRTGNAQAKSARRARGADCGSGRAACTPRTAVAGGGNAARTQARLHRMASKEAR